MKLTLTGGQVITAREALSGLATARNLPAKFVLRLRRQIWSTLNSNAQELLNIRNEVISKHGVVSGKQDQQEEINRANEEWGAVINDKYDVEIEPLKVSEIEALIEEHGESLSGGFSAADINHLIDVGILTE